MKTFVHEGKRLTYTNASTAIASGDVVVLGSTRIGVAVTDIAATTGVGEVSVQGVHVLAATTAEAYSVGDVLYWSTATKKLTSTATAIIAGHAAKTKVAVTDTTAEVLLAAVGINTTVVDSITTGAIVGSDASLGVAGLPGSTGAGGIVAVVGGAGDTGAGGAVTVVGGAGSGAAAGGAASVIGGASGAGATGNGGAVAATGGAAASTNGIGGAASLTGGIGKGNLAGGAGSVVGGVGGATGIGGAIAVTGGAGGSTSGTGGAVAIAAGAGTAGDANGGAVTILAGNANGSGTDGTLGLGTSNTSAITIGATSIATAIPGPITPGVGASTAAAGSTVADATALPAGTASIYPTTGADDTKGVLLTASDKVTGRLLFIGNGVSNKILKVYGPSGAVINGAAADAAFSSASGKGVVICCLSGVGNTWLAW